MNRLAIIAAFFALFFLAGHGAMAQSGYDLFQKGLVAERTEGDLDEAIRLYKQIIAEHKDNRALVAKALVQMGGCYEKLGRGEARKAYEQVIQEFADQSEAVRAARRQLEQLDSGSQGGPTYRLVLDSKIAGMPVENGDWKRHLDFSPSGDRIVFESQGRLYIADETGTLIRPIQDSFLPWESFDWVRWSPDGRQIAYLAWREVTLDSGEKDSMFALFVVSPDDGTVRQLTPEQGSDSFFWLRWTYDGQHLTYLGRDGIHTLDLNGKEVRFVPRADLPGRPFRGSDCEYSPNGRWLAYCAFREDSSPERARNIWILPAAGGQAQPLRHSLAILESPAWAPDGGTLYFVAGTSNAGNIRRVAIDPETGLQRGQPQQVTFFNDAKVMFPRALDDGRRIAFELQRINTSIQVANGSPPYEQRTLARGYAHLPQVSPDGQTVYYVADGIYAVSREGGTPRKLTGTRPLPTHSYLTNFHLSGDGQTLAYVAKLGEKPGLFTLPVSGGEPRLIVEITGQDVVPQWSPDGSQLTYATGNDLYVVDAAGGQPSRIAHLKDTGDRHTGWDAWTVRWSPDGKFIAAIGHPKPTVSNAVFVVPASGGELRQLTPDSPYYLEGVEWHPDSKRLSYNVDRRESETRLAYVDGRPTTLLVNHPDGWDYIGSWAPDGGRFFFQCESEGKGWGLYAYEETSGNITLFAEHMDGQSPPSWSRNGKTAAWWATRKTERQAWIMENFLPED